MISTTLQEVSLPVGSITAFAGKVQKYNGQAPSDPHTIVPEPYGWMVCDGSALNASQYPELYAVLGDLYGSSGSGSSLTFNLPDLSGQFLRGIGTDSSSTENRTAAPGGTANGVGSTQKDALQTHQHAYNEPFGASPGDSGAAFASIQSAFTGAPEQGTGPSTVKVSSSETRPTNVFVYYLIKYTYQLPKLNVAPFHP